MDETRETPGRPSPTRPGPPHRPPHPQRSGAPLPRPAPAPPTPPSGPPLPLPGPPEPSPLVELADERTAARGVRLLLKRDDLLHPHLVGNKYRKLRLNLAAARRAGHTTLLTFGGAYSNHLRATAAAGRLHGFRTVGVVRGDELAGRPLNPSLARAAADGMRLHFLDRGTYRRKGEPAVLADLLRAYGPAYVLPEGGSNAAAVHGCAGLGRELAGAADVAVVACGTGGTLAGLAAAFPGESIGVAVLRGDFLPDEVLRLQREAFGGRRGRWRVAGGFHHGGYARGTPELAAFAADFAARHALPPLEPVYVAKALYAAVTLAARGAFAPGTRLAVVVTG